MTLNPGSNDPRVEALRDEYSRRMTRFFITFAFVEVTILAAALVCVFVLELVDTRIGLAIVIAIALIGGLVMVLTLMSRRQAHQRDLEDLTGR